MDFPFVCPEQCIPDIQTNYCVWPNANPVFRQIQCFQNSHHGCPDWSWSYCTEVMIVMALSFVNLVLLTYLLYIDVRLTRAKQGNDWHKSYLCRTKTQILLLCIVVCLLQWVRNFFQPTLVSNFVYNGSLTLCQGLKYGIYMCTFWFFIKQSSSLIMAQTIKHFVRFLKYLTYGSLLAYSIYVVQWIVVKAAHHTTEEKFCHNFEFIFGETIQMILTSVFLGFSYLLAKEINKQNAVLVERVQTTGDELTRSDRQTLKARVDSLKSLKIIVWTFWLSTAFNLLYSIITRILQGNNCFIVPRVPSLNALLKLFDRLDAFVIWMWPLIYLFWPTRRHLIQQKRIDHISDVINSTESQSIFQSEEAHNSINRYAPIEYPVLGNYRVNPTELSSSSSDDNEYDFRGYHNAQPFKITR